MKIDFRTEYPRPDFERSNWLCLNGVWDFTFDHARSGEARGYAEASAFDMKINVPYAPQSKLSGIEYTDYIQGAWYTRSFDLPCDWRTADKRIFINIGACDFYTKVFINGKNAGEHRGGYTPFAFDITDHLTEGENRITVYVTDDERNTGISSGKQAMEPIPSGAFYTRTTGIWQSVWLECIPTAHIKSIRMTPNAEEGELRVDIATVGCEDMILKAEISFEGTHITTVEKKISWDNLSFSIFLEDVKLWDIGQPNLYDIVFTVGDDSVKSYFGMRDIALKNRVMYLNGKPVFQRLVLDQGFYPDGLYTAPCDEELKADIERSVAMGFNGARLHMKIFEPRFLYYCDKAGYIVWDEFPSWGLDTCKFDVVFQNSVGEWQELLMRDYNHPSVIGWCPMNETGYLVDREYTRYLYNITKAIDPKRLFIGNSGWCHVEGTYDLLDAHDYEQDPATFREKYWPLTEGKKVKFRDGYTHTMAAWMESSELCFMSEFGGTRWVIDASDRGEDWGYGDAPKTEDEFIERYKGLCDALLENKAFSGFCYTQLYDIETECNGLYTYDRKPKFDPDIIKPITSKKSVIE